MKKLLLISICAFSFSVNAQSFSSKSIDELDQYFESRNDTTYVFNFWATWCKPCIKEMPYFEKLQEKYADKPLRVVFVSVDDPSHVESRLKPFLKKKKLKCKVLHIKDRDPNSWINRVHGDWSGAVPATLVVSAEHAYRELYEKELTFEELENIVKPLIIEN